MYKHFFKRLIDIVLSAIGIVVLTPVWIILAIAIKIDDPGPVFFKQKRIAQNKNGEKQYFTVLKYRSMKMNTPHDMPTDMLENPEQYKFSSSESFVRLHSMIYRRYFVSGWGIVV